MDPKQESMNDEDVDTKTAINDKGEKDINKEYDMDNYDDGMFKKIFIESNVGCSNVPKQAGIAKIYTFFIH